MKALRGFHWRHRRRSATLKALPPPGGLVETAVTCMPAPPLPALSWRAAERWQPWDTPKFEERLTRLSIINELTGQGWSGDDAVDFLDVSGQVNPAMLWAIRLELATWAYGSESLYLN